MYDTILVPIDGSDSMTPIVEDAAAFAAEREASVFLLYVVDKRAFLTLAQERQDEVCDELESKGAAALDVAKEAMAEYGVDAETTLRRGDPADEILDYAREIDADLIAMGTHARFEDNILGSVSRSVVIESDIPVLATPIKAD
ncbi:universal stress protein [Haloferax sp. MBLA0076]|uniref:Universal stress protein n=1 Tax=Haloferax litoreum TaxID=2666140 RepID=A0A6A8GG35_9EURY|nr:MULTISPECIES: universal stress protein [Haloferax]KAB1193330.1 universal stress protein [Haloferax sp. CBA1148]MRX21836.1 universal stress protein [Haloferax litoreum]